MRNNRPMLAVYTSTESFVPNYEALEQGHLRFIGRKLEGSLGSKTFKQQTKVRVPYNKGGFSSAITEIKAETKEIKIGGWIVLEKAEKVPHRAEYIQSLKKGDLLPADQQTAALAGLTGVYEGLPSIYQFKE